MAAIFLGGGGGGGGYPCLHRYKVFYTNGHAWITVYYLPFMPIMTAC